MASDEPGAFLTRETGRRALVTLGVLCLYRLGCQIPLPGLDPDLTRFHGPLGVALGRLSIFAIGLTPVFTALLLIEVARLGFPRLGRRDVADDQGTPRLRRTVQVLALLIAAFQGYGVSRGIEGVSGVIEEPGVMFEATVATTLVAATALLGWLGDRITAQGLGPGFWILLVAPLVARLPSAGVLLWELERVGATDASTLPIVLLFIAAASAAIVMLAKARAQDGRRDNAAPIDVWPPLLAQSILGMAVALASAILNISSASLLPTGGAFRMLLMAILIGLFTWLRRPSRADGVNGPLRLIAMAQIVVCCGGELLARILGLPFAIDGAWLIVIVATALSVQRRARGDDVQILPGM